MSESPPDTEASDAQPLSVTALAMELGLISQQEAQLAEARRQALKRGGIKISIGQTLLERRFIAPHQVKTLMKEFERRMSQNMLRRNQVSGVPLRKLGQYEILEVLSEKSHSRIYKARDMSMERQVVLKVLPRMLKDDPQWAERFKRETMLLGKLGHPNLVQAFTATEIEGCPTIVMEFVEGASIGDRIEDEGNLPEKEAWLIGREVARALSYTARAGIIHRDIKPDNIVCSKGGKVKLIDMGFSKSTSDTSHLTSEGTTVGTPFYISPEQARGTRDLDVRTDVYSLGCSIFHMLTGCPPFYGDNITDVMLKHLEAHRPDPRTLAPEVTEGSAKLVMRMMAVDPARRPQNPDAVVEEVNVLIPSLPKLFGAILEPTKPARKSDVFRIPAKTADSPAVPAQRVGRISAPRRGGVWGWVKGWWGG